jgi:hypothetical protein
MVTASLGLEAAGPPYPNPNASDSAPFLKKIKKKKKKKRARRRKNGRRKRKEYT